MNQKKVRNLLLSEIRQKEQEKNMLESKLATLHEKYKSLESELRKTELHKELRGKFLKNLESLLTMADFVASSNQQSTSQTEQVPKPSTIIAFKGKASIQLS